MRKIVEKKILPKYFDAVIHDKKKFEIRKDEVEDTRHRHSEKIFLSYFPYKPKKGCEKL